MAILVSFTCVPLVVLKRFECQTRNHQSVNKNQYPRFIKHHCMKLLLLLCQPFVFHSCSQQEQAPYKPCTTPQFHYFDCYDTEDDIIFVNCFKDLPDFFNNCVLIIMILAMMTSTINTVKRVQTNSVVSTYLLLYKKLLTPIPMILLYASF